MKEDEYALIDLHGERGLAVPEGATQRLLASARRFAPVMALVLPGDSGFEVIARALAGSRNSHYRT